MQQRMVFAGRSDHLGSCLLNLAAGRQLAEALGAEFISVWPPSRLDRADLALQALFDDLPFEVIDDVPATDVTIEKTSPALTREGIDPSVLASARTIHFKLSGIVPVAGEDRRAAIDRARFMMRCLPVKPDLRDACTAAATAAQIDHKTAVHIRRGDIIELLRRPDTGARRRRTVIQWFIGRFAELEAYAEAAGGDDIVLFTDGPEEVERFRALLPGRVATIDVDPLGRLTPHQRDMAEMLAMSQARKIVASVSNFSGFAAFYGDRPLERVGPHVSPSRIAREIRRLFDDATVGDIEAAYAARQSAPAPRR